MDKRDHTRNVQHPQLAYLLCPKSSVLQHVFQV